MSSNSFLPPNRENIGYKVFPLPNKSIRLDDPNYIHYAITEPLFGDRFDSERKDSGASYNAPYDDDRTILRTHVSVSSFRRSHSGSLTPSSPQKVAVSPLTLKEPETQTPIESSQPVATDKQSPIDIDHRSPSIEDPQILLDQIQSSVINYENSNLVDRNQNFHYANDYAYGDPRDNADNADNASNTDKAENTYVTDNVDKEVKKETDDSDDRIYAVIAPRDERTPPQFGRSDNEQRLVESEYDMAIGPPAFDNAELDIEIVTHTSTVTPPSTISEDDQQQPSYIQASAITVKRASLPPAYYEELKQVTSTLGAIMQMKEEQKEATIRKEQEVETEREKVKIDYTAEKFLDQVPVTDNEGVQLSDTQRLNLAQQLAEKRLAEKEAELLAEFEEWKRVRDLEIQWSVRGNSPPLNGTK